MLDIEYVNGKPKIVNQQSEEYARILFDEDVERELRLKGYSSEVYPHMSVAGTWPMIGGICLLLKEYWRDKGSGHGLCMM